MGLEWGPGTAFPGYSLAGVAAAPARIGTVLNTSIPGPLLRDKNSRQRGPSCGLSFSRSVCPVLCRGGIWRKRRVQGYPWLHSEFRSSLEYEMAGEGICFDTLLPEFDHQDPLDVSSEPTSLSFSSNFRTHKHTDACMHAHMYIHEHTV